MSWWRNFEKGQSDHAESDRKISVHFSQSYAIDITSVSHRGGRGGGWVQLGLVMLCKLWTERNWFINLTDVCGATVWILRKWGFRRRCFFCQRMWTCFCLSYSKPHSLTIVPKCKHCAWTEGKRKEDTVEGIFLSFHQITERVRQQGQD